MLTMICGNVGSGKTLFLAILGFYSKLPVISNFELTYPKNIAKKVKKFDLYDFINSKYENALVFIDESYMYSDARNSMSEQNKLMSYMLFQSRKKNLHIYQTMQLRSSMDIRFRSLADNIIYCENKISAFQYTLINIAEMQKSVNVLPLSKAREFFPYYNTYEVIEKGNDEPKTQYLRREERMKLADKYAEDISTFYSEKKRNKITKTNIKYYLQKEKIDMGFTDSIYLVLQST